MKFLRCLLVGGSLAAICGGCGFGTRAWQQPPPPVSQASIVQAGQLHRTTLDNDLLDYLDLVEGGLDTIDKLKLEEAIPDGDSQQ